MTPRWDLTLGARVAFDEQEADIFSRAPQGLGVGAALADQEDFETHLDLSETDVSPKIALTHRWSDEITLFANVAKGFKSGGYDNAPLNDDHLQYDAEEAISYEAGVKSRILDGAMMVNATAFWMDLENLQVRNFTGVTFTTDNADEVTSRGFELDVQWLPPLDGLTIGGSVGLIDAEFDSFPNGTAIAGSGEDEQDLSGRELPYTPDLSASLFPSFLFPVLPSWNVGGVVGVDFLYRSGRFLDNDLDPATFQDATTRVNARLGLLGGDGRWRIVFNAKNLTSEQERLLMIDQPLLEGNYVAFPLVDEPTFTVDFRLSFG
jgi:iron complex outermembrane recepter protein